MRKQLAVIAGALTAAALIGAPAASASTEFGDTCVGNDAVPAPYTLATLSAPAGPVPLTAPTAGVITKVKVSYENALPLSVPITVKLLRSAGGENYTVVGETPVTVSSTVNVAEAKIPVQVGDRLGLHGEPFTYEGTAYPGLALLCEGSGDGSILGATLTSSPPGSTIALPPATEGAVPVTAVIEPDADNDGFGDETQDKCPQSAAVQVACPLIVVDAIPLAQKGSVLVLVSTSEAAPVTVSGTVALPKPSKGKAGSSALAKLKAPVQTVTPGKLARFKLKFPGPLKSALASLPPGKSLKLTVAATSTNVAGAVSKDSAKLKLKG